MNILLVIVVSFSLSLLIGVCWTIKCLIDVNNVPDDVAIDDVIIEEECEAQEIFEMENIQPTNTQTSRADIGAQCGRLSGVNNEAYF